MFQIQILTLGDYQTNCYIIKHKRSKTCCVIDPGSDAQTILDILRDMKLTLEAILLTHAHFDHVGAVKELAAEADCAVYLCPDDLSMPPAFTAGPLYYTHTYKEGDILHLAGLEFHVMHTPGHTPGSVCLIADDALFTGDTLFAGSCGRTDLPGGSAEQICASLARLASLERDYYIYPGHGCNTTLAEEKQHNPYLKLRDPE